VAALPNTITNRKKFDLDIENTKQKISEFKQSVTNLIKSSDLSPSTKKWLIIGAMEELNMLEAPNA